MAKQQDKPEPEIIRLLDASGATVLDSVSAEYEDSFCLESFGDLVRLAEDADPAGSKHFIIARVQTWDHKQPDRAFYSYYHAHHLNKILFQTQVYLNKKLIHRLHVLNPLTNTDIIGNVLYFMVKGKSVKKADGSIVPWATVSSTAAPIDDKMPLPSPTVAKFPAFADPVLLNRAIHNTIGDGEDAATAASQGWTLAAPKTGEVQESPMPSPKRQSLVQQVANSVAIRAKAAVGEFQPLPDIDENREHDSIAPFPQLQKIAKDDSSTRRRISLQVVTNGISKSANTNGPKTASYADKSVREAAILEEAPHSLGSNESNCAVGETKSLLIPAGQVTQHGTPMTPLQALSVVPPSAKNRRRSLSYMNAVTTSGSNGASMDAWHKMLRDDNNGKVVKSSNEVMDAAAGVFDMVRPFKDQPVPAAKEEVFYDAVLIATDNDFLEASRVRTIFRENATAPSDAALFEMPPVTEATLAGSPRQIETDLVPGCSPCCPTEAQIQNMNICLQFFHRTKSYLLIIGIFVVILVLVWQAALRTASSSK